MIKWINANLSFENKEILKNLNLSVNSGEKILLKTRSGSGKTTLLKTALGIKQLDSGSIFINNKELNSKNISEIRGDIFYLDQKISLPELIVEEFLIELFHYQNNRTKTLDINRVKQLSTEFQLDDNILRSSIKDLSGGERQRLAIITGIVLDKPIWLLDEPTSALDMELKELVVSKIKDMNITAIIISHDKCWEAL